MFAEFKKILGIYSLLLIIFGVLTGICGFALSFKLRQTPTFVFLSFSFVSNVFTLLVWNLNSFLNPWFNIDLLNSSLFSCNFGTFFQFTSFEISAWFLVLISFEQFLAVRFNLWRTVYFKAKRAFLVSVGLVLLFIGLNSHMLVSYGHEADFGNFTQVFCFRVPSIPQTRWIEQWTLGYIFLYSLIPFSLLLLSNFLLIWTIRARQAVRSSAHPVSSNHGSANGHHKHENKFLNRMVLFLTALFIAMTLPSAVVSFFYGELYRTPLGNAVVNFIGALTFSYHGLNFFILIASNKRFREQMVQLIGVAHLFSK
nr:G protein-coupled receptor [Proales similis]